MIQELWPEFLGALGKIDPRKDWEATRFGVDRDLRLCGFGQRQRDAQDAVLDRGLNLLEVDDVGWLERAEAVSSAGDDNDDIVGDDAPGHLLAPHFEFGLVLFELLTRDATEADRARRQRQLPKLVPSAVKGNERATMVELYDALVEHEREEKEKLERNPNADKEPLSPLFFVQALADPPDVNKKRS